MGRPRIRSESCKEKRCPKCGELKQRHHFYKMKASNDGLAGYCKPCSLSNTRENKRSRKKQAIEYKGGCCERCGGIFHPAAFEFHHISPHEKEKDPCKINSWESMRKELDKCLLLCANCHRIEHHGGNYE